MMGTHIYIKFAKASTEILLVYILLICILMSIYLPQNQKKIIIYIWQKNIIKKVVKKAIAHLMKNLKI